MLKKLASWLLYKQLKWKKKVTIAFPDKFIICLAPHTSNWDFSLDNSTRRLKVYEVIS